MFFNLFQNDFKWNKNNLLFYLQEIDPILVIMEWNLMNADGIRNLRSGLGSKLGEDYIIADECEW